ncbi:MAG: succinyl-diaminopimelate desuccinylase [Acidimicrobiales bacterium]
MTVGGPDAGGPAADLLAATAELVDVDSVSHHEAALADLVEARLRAVAGLAVERIGDNVVARTRHDLSNRLLLAGHLDTVPPAGNAGARVDGDTLWGVGSADMKGGLAVMLALAGAVEEPAVDLTWVFYVAEEVAREHNGLLAIERARPDLLTADAVILGEPTGSVVEAGCQGVLKVEVTLAGRRAHTARPWMGANALHRLAPLLTALAGFDARQPVVDGCRYREALQAVAVTGGVAANVVPDRAVLTLNHRFAPDRDAAAAEVALRARLETFLDAAAGDVMAVVDAAPPALPGLDHPLLAALLAATGVEAKAKLGWTDVAFFAERGIPAANFGPGDPELAHAAEERVDRADLDRAFAVLRSLVTGAAGRHRRRSTVVTRP